MPVTSYERAAYKRGVDAAADAASWVLDGNRDEAHYRRLLAMIEEGDPEVHDLLPPAPDLSGEDADALTPTSLALAVGMPIPEDETEWAEAVAGIAEAFELGVAEIFVRICEAHIRSALGV